MLGGEAVDVDSVTLIISGVVVSVVVVAVDSVTLEIVGSVVVSLIEDSVDDGRATSLSTGADGEITESDDSLVAVGREVATSAKSKRVTEIGAGTGTRMRDDPPVGATVRVGSADAILAGAVTMLTRGRRCC